MPSKGSALRLPFQHMLVASQLSVPAKAAAASEVLSQPFSSQTVASTQRSFWTESG